MCLFLTPQKGNAPLAETGCTALLVWIKSSKENAGLVLSTDLMKNAAKRVAAPCIVAPGSVSSDSASAVSEAAASRKGSGSEGASAAVGGGVVDVAAVKKKTCLVEVLAALVKAGAVPGKIRLICKAGAKAREEGEGLAKEVGRSDKTALQALSKLLGVLAELDVAAAKLPEGKGGGEEEEGEEEDTTTEDEEEERNQTKGERMDETGVIRRLSLLPYSFSSPAHLRREGNRIVHHGADSFDTCVFSFPIKEVCFFYSFSFLLVSFLYCLSLKY